MKVLLSRQGGLFVCGTNAFNPLCANYTVSKNWIWRQDERFATIAASQFRVCILQWPHLKASYITTLHEGCLNSKAPPNAPHKCGLLFPLFGGCTASILHVLTYPKILCVSKKEREKMATLRCVYCHFRGPGRQKSWHKGKTTGDTTRKCSKGYLTTVDTVNKVSPKDSHSKTTKAGSFEGCRPWIETQQLSNFPRTEGSL